MRTALYRLYENNTLLYVGISQQVFQRLCNHNRATHWCEQVTNIKLEYFHTLGEAMKAEREAVHNEKPLYNKHFCTGHELRNANKSYQELQSRINWNDYTLPQPRSNRRLRRLLDKL